MPDSLEEMLAKAQVAETSISKDQKVEQPQAQASAEAQLRDKLKQREGALGEAKQAEGERRKAADLKLKAETLIQGKESITPEMQAFLSAANDAERAQQDKLSELNARIGDFEGDPAVLETLHAEANEMNQRKDLNKEFYKLENNNRKNLNHNGQHGEAYHRDIGGTHSQDDPVALLEMYGSMATGEWHDRKATLDEAQKVIDVMRRIDGEASKPNADMQKIDNEFAQFLYERLQHFANTIDQRVDKAAQGLADHYKEKPDEARRYQVEDSSFEYWKQKLSSQLPDVQGYMRRAEMIMQRQGFKAKELAKLGETLGNKSYIAGGMECNTFVVDNFKEKGK